MNGQQQYCAGCVTAVRTESPCTECAWDDHTQPELPSHLPRHYLLQGQYYIGRVLGQGGFGVTYLARDMKLNRQVAVKEYLPSMLCSRMADRVTVRSFGGDREEHYRYGLNSFLQEARTLALFEDHPCIVPIIGCIEANGTAYMVMSYVNGRTLKQYLVEHGGKIPWRNAIAIMMPVMDALRAVHEKGLLHRDISPDNIMITRQNQVRLLDFGAARMATGEQSQSLSMILKPGFAPEEQYTSRGRQGPWTDVYAAGATLYRAITGHMPPASPDRKEQDDMPPLSAYCPDLPANVQAVILRAMAVKSSQRFQTMGDFQHALAKAIEHAGNFAQQQPGAGQPFTPQQTWPGHPPQGTWPPQGQPGPGTYPPYVTPTPPSKGVGKGLLIAGGVVMATVVVVGLIVFIVTVLQKPTPPTPTPTISSTTEPTTPSGSTTPSDSSTPSGSTGQSNSPSETPSLDSQIPSLQNNNTTTTVTPQDESDPDWVVVDNALDQKASTYKGAYARVYIENDTDSTLRVAVRYVNMGDKWVTVGWRVVGPRKKLNTHIVTPDDVVYFHAEYSDGRQWPSAEKRDRTEEVVTDHLFVHLDSEPLQGTDPHEINMSKIGVHTGDNTIWFK